MKSQKSLKQRGGRRVREGGRGSSEGKQLGDDAMIGLKMEERGPEPRDAGGLQKLRSECRKTERGVSRRQAASRDLAFSQ